MSRFHISLCLVFILASTASAKFNSSALNSTISRIDSRIAFKINEFATVYSFTRNTTNEIFTTILQKVRAFRIEKPKEILTDLEKRRSEFNRLIGNVVNSKLRECLPVMNQLYKKANESIERIRKCVDWQLEAVSANITKVKDSVKKGLAELDSYKEKAVKCLTQHANGTSIIGCLRAIKLELNLKRRADFASTIARLERWEASMETKLLSCAGKSINAYYEHSSGLVTAVARCMETKDEPSTIASSVGLD